MFLGQSHESGGSAASFLLGAGCAAMLVLSFAGASLALSHGVGRDVHKPGLSELRLNQAPRPIGGLSGAA